MRSSDGPQLARLFQPRRRRLQVARLDQGLRLVEQSHGAALRLRVLLLLARQLRESRERPRAILGAAETAIRARQMVVDLRFVGAQPDGASTRRGPPAKRPRRL